jgi:carboxylesterase
VYEAGEVGCLLVHGYTSTPHEMRGLARYLADRGITASACLLAGHGTCPQDLQGKCWQDWYASVNDALDELLARCRRVYMAGLSLGGALTLYTAAHRGHDLAGIVAMCAPIYIPTGVGHLLKRLQPGMPFLSKPYRDIEDPQAKAAHISYLQSPVDATASLIEFLVHVRSALPKIKVPALIIYARHDHVVPGISSHHIYSRLGSPYKRMLVLHRGYHIVTVDTDRQRVFEAVHEFIAGREEQRRQQEQRGRTGQAFGSGGRQQERSA